MQQFHFDFKQLSFADQKAIYNHFDPFGFFTDEVNKAESLEEIQSIYYEEENADAFHLTYLAAMLAHGVASVNRKEVERNGEPHTLVTVDLNPGYILEEQFDVAWYDGLNSEGNGVIALADTVELYQLEKLDSMLKK